MHQPTARICGQDRPDRDQAALVPLDHRLERVDDHQLAYALVDQHGLGGVAEPQSAHCDVELGPLDPGQRAPSHFDLGNGEEAGHEELVAELDLEDVDAGDRVAAPAEAAVSYT